MKKISLILLGLFLTCQSLMAQQNCILTNATATGPWTHAGTGNSVSIANNRVFFNNAVDQREDRMWRTAPRLDQNSAWKVEFDFNASAQSYAAHNLMAYTSTNQDVQFTAWDIINPPVNSSMDGCYVNYFSPYNAAPNPTVNIIAKQGTTTFQSPAIAVPNINATYYVILTRLNGRTLRLSVFSDAARTVAVGTPVECIIPCNLGAINAQGQGGLQFLQSGTNWGGGNTRQLTATVGNVNLCAIPPDLSNPVVNAALPLPAVNDVTICAGNSATLSVPVDYNLSYSWYTTATGTYSPSTLYSYTTPVLTTPGTYTYYVSYKTKCNETSNRKAVNVTVLPSPQQATITGNTTVCVNQIAELISSNPAGVWSSANPAIATVKQTGVVRGVSAGTTIIYNTVTSGSCSAVASFTLTVNDVLTFQITGPSPVCPSTSGNQYQVSPSVPGADYTWNIENAPSVGVNFPVNGSNTSLLTIPSAGTVAGNTFTLRCQGRNACGLSPMITKQITISSDVPNQPNITCSGDNCANLSVTNQGNSSIVWTNGSTGAVIGTGNTIVRPLSTVVYCTFTSPSGCTSRTAYSPAVVCTYSARLAEAPASNQSALTLYPNPSDGEFTFETIGYNGHAQVLNMQGMVVQEFDLLESQKVYSVNIKSQQKGQYLLRLTGGPESKASLFITQ